MSANNYLLVKMNAEGKFVVSNLDADTNLGSEVGIFSYATDAMSFANKYCEENVVEYGIRFVDEIKSNWTLTEIDRLYSDDPKLTAQKINELVDIVNLLIKERNEK